MTNFKIKEVIMDVQEMIVEKTDYVENVKSFMDEWDVKIDDTTELVRLLNHYTKILHENIKA